MRENDEFILDIKRLGINGEGIGFYNKLAIFVPNAIPGEGHNIKITKVLNKMAFGESIELKHYVDYRVEPSCKYYNECGGCSVMHIKYDKMLEFKRDLVIESLNRYTKLNVKSFEIRPTLASPEIFGYRNKSSLPIRKEDGVTYPAMIKEGSNITIPVTECKVQNQLINKINNELCKLIDKLGIEMYLHKYNKGVVKYLVTRVNTKNEAIVAIIVNQMDDKLNELAKLALKIEGVKGVYVSVNNKDKPGEIFGPKTTLLSGSEYIIEEIGSIKYKVYPQTFFQLNTLQTKNLYDLVLKACKLSHKENVLDAYSGVGTIALYLAKMSNKVTGIEINKDSVLAATENASLNKIKNTEFIAGDAAKVLPKMLAEGKTFDVVVVDPPRTGLPQEFINAILEANIKRLVYVSCNPATLAKNIEDLSAKYQVKHISPVDMFPNTPHVETVSLLELKKA